MPVPSDVASVAWEEADDSVWSRGFTMIPNAILIDSGLSPRAINAYLLLSHYSTRPSAEWPGQERLAELAGCTEKTLRLAVKELADAGLVKSRRRGLGQTNQYVLVEPRVPKLSVQERAPTPVQEPVVVTDPSLPLEDRKPKTKNPPNPPGSEVAISTVGERPANRPKSVDRKAVTDAEYFAAVAALDVFNSKAGTKYASVDWVSKIVMRIREHPDLPTVGHAAVIFTAFNDPWWTGVPSPSVVYGNAALFERALHAVALAAEGGGNVTADDAATYGTVWGPGTAYATAAEARAAGASANAAAVDADFEEIHGE